MLRTLRVRELAIIEDLTVEFGPGLNLLTGETGAGKSILVDALGLVTGDRADSSKVRRGASRARVEAVFEPPDAGALRGLLEQRGIDADEDGLLVLRREVPVSGAARVFINGSPGTVTALRELGERLLELHGQHEQHGLLSADSHLELLDRFGGHHDELRGVAAAERAVGEARERLERLREAERERERRADNLRGELREIDAVAPRAGERDELERERTRLRHGVEIAELVGEALAQLYDGDPSAAGLAASGARRLERLAELDPRLGELAQRVRAAQLELQEAGSALRDYADEGQGDPDRLEDLESRRAAIERLCSRYGRDEQEVLEHRAAAAAELDELEHLGEQVGAAETALALAAEAYAGEATRLSAARRSAAQALAPAVERQLRELALPRARFSVGFQAARGPELRHGDRAMPLTPRGVERAEFLIAANPGEDARPLRKTASGGELSRVMLALHVVLEDAGPGRALVFVEVDAGVGGATADAVGARLQRLARARQVLCVTHLPQVAAYADRHYHVRKRVAGGRTLVDVVPLSRTERVDELARMLGGRKVSAASRKNVAELLAGAGPGRPTGRTAEH